MDFTEEFKILLQDAAARLGKDIQADLSDTATYASQRMRHLARAINEPGFQEALLAERDAVAMKAGISAVNAGDLADAELMGLISGALAIGARALSTVV